MEHSTIKYFQETLYEIIDALHDYTMGAACEAPEAQRRLMVKKAEDLLSVVGSYKQEGKAKERADMAADKLQEWRDRSTGDNAATYFVGVLVRQYHNAGDEKQVARETFICGKETAYIVEALKQQASYQFDVLQVLPVYSLIDY